MKRYHLVLLTFLVVAIGAILSLIINKAQHKIETIHCERYDIIPFDDLNKAAGVDGGTITISLDNKVYSLKEYSYLTWAPQYHLQIIDSLEVILTTSGKEYRVPVIAKDSYPAEISVKYEGQEIGSDSKIEIYQYELIDERFEVSATEKKNDVTQKLEALTLVDKVDTSQLGDQKISWHVSDGINDTNFTVHVSVKENTDNVGMNKDGIMELKYPHLESALVTRKRALPKDYVPELSFIPAKYSVSDGYRATPTVSYATTYLIDAMYEETGLWMFVTSSYRNNELQERLYTGYIAQYGQEEADRLSARPGTSEHQTGLVIDVVTPGGEMMKFKETKQSEWVNENAHRFGFIVRYPEGKEDITGYMPEAWHLRYVGEDIAEKVYNSGLTYDEWYRDNFVNVNMDE